MHVSEFVGYRNISDYMVTTFDSLQKCQSKFPTDVPGTERRASQ